MPGYEIFNCGPRDSLKSLKAVLYGSKILSLFRGGRSGGESAGSYAGKNCLLSKRLPSKRKNRPLHWYCKSKIRGRRLQRAIRAGVRRFKRLNHKPGQRISPSGIFRYERTSNPVLLVAGCRSLASAKSASLRRLKKFADANTTRIILCSHELFFSLVNHKQSKQKFAISCSREAFLRFWGKTNFNVTCLDATLFLATSAEPR